MRLQTDTTFYVPIVPPPTPAPSPGPGHEDQHPSLPLTLPQAPAIRLQYLSNLLHTLSPQELLFVSNTIAPLLKRDFLADLPAELALNVLVFIEDPRTLTRAARVSKRWARLVKDESVWKGMCGRWAFGGQHAIKTKDLDDEPLEEMEQFATFPMDPPLEWLAAKKRRLKVSISLILLKTDVDFSMVEAFKVSCDAFRILVSTPFQIFLYHK